MKDAGRNISRRKFGAIGAASIGVAAAGAGPAVAQSGKTFSWRMQTVDPPTFVGPSVVLPKFIKAVEQMSGGRLRIQLFTAGQLVPTAEIPAALQSGTIDISYTSPVYYTGAIAESFLTTSALPPMLVPSVLDAQELYWSRGVDEIMREAYVKNGVHFISSVFLGDPITYWSKTPRKTVADLSGFKVRSFGYAAKTFEKLGASPVFMPHEEVYTGLAQGVIDGSMTAASYYQRAKYYEHAPNFYVQGWFDAVAMSIMASRRSWDALPDDLKAIVTNAVFMLSQDLTQKTFIEYQQMKTQFGKMGATPIEWSEQDLAKVRQTAMTLLPELSAKSPGVAKGLEMIQKYLDEIKTT